MSFRHVRTKRETIGERRHLSWLYAARLAAKKEYDALVALYPKVSVPEPIDHNRHGIVMSKATGQQLAHTRLDEPDWYLDEILRQVKNAYGLGIIHCDLSEFNIFVNPAGVRSSIGPNSSNQLIRMQRSCFAGILIMYYHILTVNTGSKEISARLSTI